MKESSEGVKEPYYLAYLSTSALPFPDSFSIDGRQHEQLFPPLSAVKPQKNYNYWQELEFSCM